MPRRPRVFIEDGIYHVYHLFACGAEIFSEVDEAEWFLELLKKVKVRDGLTVFAWTLMSSHYHLSLRAGPVPLARTMAYVQSKFGQDYNSRWKSSTIPHGGIGCGALGKAREDARGGCRQKRGCDQPLG